MYNNDDDKDDEATGWTPIFTMNDNVRAACILNAFYIAPNGSDVCIEGKKTWTCAIYAAMEFNRSSECDRLFINKNWHFS